MGNQNYSDVFNINEPLAELQKMAKDFSEKMIRECISFSTDASGVAVKYLQTMPRITSTEDFANTHLKLVSQQSEKILEYTQNIFKIFQDTLQEQNSWAEEKFSKAINVTKYKAKEASK